MHTDIHTYSMHIHTHKKTHTYAGKQILTYSTTNSPTLRNRPAQLLYVPKKAYTLSEIYNIET